MKQFLTNLFIKDRNVALVILFNAIVLFILSFESYEGLWWLSATDALFLIYFLIEALLKIRLLSWKKYWASGWNRFDFLILILSLPSIFLLFADMFQNLAFIYVFRVVRVLRFF